MTDKEEIFMRDNKLFIKIVSIIALLAFLSVSIIASIPVINASAQTAQQKIDEAIKKQDEIQGQINSANTKKKASLAEKHVIDQEVAALQKNVDAINADIAVSNDKLAQKQAELELAQLECEKQYEAYCDRARVLIQKGNVSYLEIIINSESFEDFLTRVSLVKKIAEYDNNKLKELEAYAKEVEDIKIELQKENDKLKALKADVDAQMSTLRSKQAQSQKIIDDLTKDIAAFEKALQAQEAAEAAAREEIRRLTQGSSVPAYSGGKFMWPSVSTYITSEYGTRVHPVTGKVKTHSGIDVGAGHGTNIYAAADGVVLVAGWNSGGYGNYVVINHGSGLTTLYAHCSSLNVSAGQSVKKGQVIAKVGSTGLSTGPHLHFEVLVNGSHTNPWAYFN